MGDGVWPALSALLPRAAQLQVRRGDGWLGADARWRCGARGGVDGAVGEGAERTEGPTRGGMRGQVTSGGAVRVVSGVGAKGTSCMQLSGAHGLGPDGAQRLAALLQEPPPMLLPLIYPINYPLIYDLVYILIYPLIYP